MQRRMVREGNPRHECKASSTTLRSSPPSKSQARFSSCRLTWYGGFWVALH